MTTTTRLQAKSGDVPDETRAMGSKGRLEVVKLEGATAVRATFQPGFHWTEHVKPIVGTDLCQVHHVGYVISGRSMIRMADGAERELVAGDFFDVPPGHDAWVVGDEPYVTVDFTAASGPAPAPMDMASYTPPKGHSILLENERARVLEVRIKPGESSGLHQHPPCVIYQFTNTRVRFTEPGGASREAELHAGDITWSEGGWHEVENLGATDDWGIIIELKQ